MEFLPPITRMESPETRDQSLEPEGTTGLRVVVTGDIARLLLRVSAPLRESFREWPKIVVELCLGSCDNV